MGDLAALNGHKRRTDRSLFPAIRTARETSALRATSKGSSFRKVYLAYLYWLYWIREDVYIMFVEVVNKMPRKYKINGETPT